jgi:transposase-like protein
MTYANPQLTSSLGGSVHCEKVSELLAERGLSVDGNCVWRWVQAYAPEPVKSFDRVTQKRSLGQVRM